MKPAADPITSICLGLNIQGINPSANSKSSWKLPRLKDEILTLNKNNYSVPFVAIAETWLKDVITEAEITIENYNVYCADRLKYPHGGVLLYIHQKIMINEYSTFDDDICQGVFCYSKIFKCLIGCIYRPPTSGPESFSKLINFLNNFIAEFNPNNQANVFIFGDFNLPKVDWKIPFLNSSTCSNALYDNFFNFMNIHFLSQYVDRNTRKENVLDLFLSDDPNFVHLIECEDLLLSDHNLVKIYTNFFGCLNINSKENFVPVSHSPNFSNFNLQKANFERINYILKSFDWDSFVTSTPIEDFPEKFNVKIFSVLQDNCPKHKVNYVKFNSYINKRRIISRKIRKFNKILSQSGSSGLTSSSFSPSYLGKVKEKIAKLKEEQKLSYINQRKAQEDAAVSKIKYDTKYFYKYAGRFKKSFSTPSLLIDKFNNIINDPVEIANALQDHFKSVFTAPNDKLDLF